MATPWIEVSGRLPGKMKYTGRIQETLGQWTVNGKAVFFHRRDKVRERCLGYHFRATHLSVHIGVCSDE